MFSRGVRGPVVAWGKLIKHKLLEWGEDTAATIS